MDDDFQQLVAWILARIARLDHEKQTLQEVLHILGEGKDDGWAQVGTRSGEE